MALREVGSSAETHMHMRAHGTVPSHHHSKFESGRSSLEMTGTGGMGPGQFRG